MAQVVAAPELAAPRVEAPEPAPAISGNGAADPLAAYVSREADGTSTLHLMIENLHCAGCVHRVETALAPLPGVVEARVNLTARRLRLRWTGARTAADFVARLAALGYRAVPFDPDEIANARADEEKRLLRCLAVAGFAAANVMLLSVAVWAGAAEDMGAVTRSAMHWLSALIALPAIAWAGRPFFASAISALKSRALNMDVPISLAVTLAAGMSLFETARGGPHAYFDAAIALLFFLLVGRYLDSRARGQARSAAERLAVLGAAAARVVEPDGRERTVPARALVPGMVLAVAPGERLAADGRIETGTTELDSSLLTGETMPKPARPSDAVYAGTMNLSGALTVAVTAAGEDTVLAEIVRLMEAAEGRKGRYVRLADRAARLYAPLVHLAAYGAFAFWITVGGLSWQPALLIAVSVLIVTCPCALGLAVPAAQAVASGRLLRAGILVKQADALERLAAADTVVLDKTGTLTLGAPRLIRPEAMDVDALHTAARLAAASRHPLCRALVEATRMAVSPPPEIHETPGSGLSVETAEGEIRLGRRAWCGLAPDTRQGPEPELWLAHPGRLSVRFAFEDALRPAAAEAVAALGRMGLKPVLLSGDHEPAVRAAAAAAGIAEWHAACSPQDKLAYLESLAASGRKVLMAGDGLNDAPALAAAFVSISPARAADVSRAAADLVFQGEDLRALVEAVATARIARRVMLQSFAFAAAYNAVAVPIAICGLVTPLIAAIAMSSSSIIVTLNALRIRLSRKASA